MNNKEYEDAIESYVKDKYAVANTAKMLDRAIEYLGKLNDYTKGSGSDVFARIAEARKDPQAFEIMQEADVKEFVTTLEAIAKEIHEYCEAFLVKLPRAEQAMKDLEGEDFLKDKITFI